VIELGGLRNGGPTSDGAVFDLKTRRWHKIAAVPDDVGLDQAVTAWTGHELLVTNGQHVTCAPLAPTLKCVAHAGLYDPVTNRWSVTSLPGPMYGLALVAVVWTGRVVVLAALDARHGRLAVSAYGPATGRWKVITPRLPAGHRPALIQLVATYDRVLMWSQRVGKTEPDGLTDVGIDVLALPTPGSARLPPGAMSQANGRKASRSAHRSSPVIRSCSRPRCSGAADVA